MTIERKKVYIVVLNYKGWQDTLECLDSVLLSDSHAFHVVLIDNNSSDDSVPNIENWVMKKAGETPRWSESIVRKSDSGEPFQTRSIKLNSDSDIKSAIDFTFIVAGENGGFSYGNNIGIAFAKANSDCSHIWLLNNDTVIFRDTLRTLTAEFEQAASTKRLGMMGCVQRFYDSPDIVQAYAGGFDKWKVRVWNVGAGDVFRTGEVDIPPYQYINGASIFLSEECVREVGLLNEDYFMYFEELDYAERAKRKGFLMEVSDSVSIYHKYRASVSKEGEQFREYHFRKSTMTFYKRYYPLLGIVAFTKIGLLMCKNALTNRGLASVQLRALRDSIFSRVQKQG